MTRRWSLLAILIGLVLSGAPQEVSADVTSAQVERAIKRGVAFLCSRQTETGEWPGETGETALATLALLTAGESPDSPAVSRALNALSRSTQLNGHETYTIALKTMAFAAADPVKYRRFIEVYARRLEETQIARTGRFDTGSAGGWSYGLAGAGADSSNSQYAVLGLQAASDAGVPIPARVWAGSRRYWLEGQNRDGGWGYRGNTPSYGSMTCAGVSSLIITGLKRSQSREEIVGDSIRRCGSEDSDPALVAGINWLATHFSVRENPLHGGLYKLYYLYGLERAGRLSGVRFFGSHDWYREGAEELVASQDQIRGSWQGGGGEADPILGTSFALLFLAKGRVPVLVNKLRHQPFKDWNNDPDDLSNLVSVVSKDWKTLLTWQVIDPDKSSIQEMLMAPVSYLSGHSAPVFSDDAREKLKEYVAQGGFLVADACCSRPEFDHGFRELMRQLFPESELHALGPEHPIWRARHDLSPETHPLWGIEQGCRTVVVYSPTDLSCYWNVSERSATNPRVIAAVSLGQNILDYATGREPPADKLAEHKVARPEVDPPKRGALQIAKLKHTGTWNVAPLAVPNLTSTLRDRLKFDVVINHRELQASDANLIHFPLVYLHGRTGFSLSEGDIQALRRHLHPGGGTLFGDAACGAEMFDRDFRKLALALFPNHSLEPIPKHDEFYTKAIGFDLSDAQLTKAAGGTKGLPQLEGIKIDGRWAVIYSKYDIGCALEKHQTLDCKGYTSESALRIATNIVIYATLP